MRSRRLRKYRKILVLPVLLLLWVGATSLQKGKPDPTQPDPLPHANTIESSTNDLAQEYAFHPPGQRQAALQRLWLAMVLEDTQSLDLDPESLNTTGSPPGKTLLRGLNREFILALWSHLRGEDLKPSRTTKASLAFLLERPELLVSALRYALVQMEISAKRQTRSEQFLGTCSFDASTRFERHADGTIYCPREQDPSHKQVNHVGLSMLLGNHYQPRVGDLQWIDKSVEIAPGHQIVDIGAGTGAYAFPLAEKVGENGKIWALEIEQTLVDYLEFMTQELEISNIEPVKTLEDDFRMPASTAEIALIVDLDLCSIAPRKFFSGTLGQQIQNTLKPNGRLVIIRAYATPAYQQFKEILEPIGFVLETREYNEQFGRELLVFQKI